MSPSFCISKGDEVVSLGAEERAGGQLDLKSAEYLREFRLEDGMPIWVYHVRDFVIEKRVSMPHLQNTVHVSYQISGAGNRRGSSCGRPFISGITRTRSISPWRSRTS